MTPFNTKKQNSDPTWAWRINRFQWMSKTAFSQLASRLNVKRTWTRNLSHRIIRKVRTHTAMVWMNVTFGRKPLNFNGLMAG